MHVLMVSKACLLGAYQTKLEAIARAPDVDLSVIVPPLWRDPAGVVHLERAHTRGYRLIVDPVRLNGHFHLHYYPRLPRRLDALRPDILHMDEEPYNLATWLALRQASARGIRALFFSWQNIYQQYPWPFRLLERQVLARADYGLMGNEAALKVWRRKGFTGPASVLPQFGVSPTLFQPPDPRPPAGPIRLGAAGRLVREKGQDLLLRAAAGLPGAWEIWLIGDGPARAHLVRLADELDIQDRVRFLGARGSLEMPALLQQLDVLVLPSRSRSGWKEQFGRVLIEAMACEVAVIGSESGEIPRVIGDAGLTFPEEDVAALRARLQCLLDSPARRRALGQAGRQRVLQYYTQERIAAETVEVYRAMIGPPPGPAMA